jgi:acyl-CoA thioesterase
LPAVHRTGDHTWRTDDHMFGEGLLINPNEKLYRIDGGETVVHSMWIAEEENSGRRCLAATTLFTREGRLVGPTDYEVAQLHGGRSFAFVNITASQPERGTIAHTQLVLVGDLSGPSHQGEHVPDVDWADATDDLSDLVSPPVRVVGGGAIGDPTAGDPQLRLILPIPSDITSALERRMYVAYATDHLLIGAALRPHSGIGYRTKGAFYTAVLGHSLRFWGDIPAGRELRLDIISPVMADSAGVAIGHGYGEDGTLLFTCVQDVVARPVG